MESPPALTRVPKSHLTIDCEFPLYALTAQARKGVSIRCDRVPAKQGTRDEGIVAFLNPLDAYLEMLVDGGRKPWRITPFEQIDSTHFINTHHYVLRILLAYGVAATSDQLIALPGTSNSPRWLVGAFEFHIPRQANRDGKYLVCRIDSIEHVKRIHSRSNIPAYGAQILSLGEQLDSDSLRRSAEEALASATFTNPSSEQTHVGLYDAEAKCWRFASAFPALVQ